MTTAEPRSSADLRRWWAAACVALLGVLAAGAQAETGPSVLLEELTAPELQARVAAGATTALVPIGGTEQNGPHMALGKHNARAGLLAARIAARLGNAIVAPVIAYVPEGNIDPPSQHMRWPGTLSIPVPAFEATLEGAARSLRRHGFTDIVLLADHGGYTTSLDRVAHKLTREWAATKGQQPPARVHALTEYYAAAQAPYNAALAKHGVRAAEIGTHAGLADTALTLALAPALVHMDKAAARLPGAHDGVTGDPRRASAELGQLGVDGIIDAAVAAIRARTARPR